MATYTTHTWIKILFKMNIRSVYTNMQFHVNTPYQLVASYYICNIPTLSLLDLLRYNDQQDNFSNKNDTTKGRCQHERSYLLIPFQYKASTSNLQFVHTSIYTFKAILLFTQFMNLSLHGVLVHPIHLCDQFQFRELLVLEFDSMCSFILISTNPQSPTSTTVR